MDRQLKPGAGLNPDIVIEKGSTCFVLCENEETKKQIFDHYRQTGTAAVIGKIDPAQFPNVSPADTAKHFARITGVDHNTVMRNLEIMGGDLTRGAKNEPDFRKKVYAAVMCAADRETLVVDDFLKQESRDFENGFLQLLANLVNDGKKILYLSCEYFESQKSLNDKIKVEGFESFEIEDIEKVTLR
jgi:hypothetical protein